ncbi:MAG: sodium-dependent transporter [Maricaulaceae bacterium]
MAGLSSAPTAQWSSRFAFIMAAVGSSVGLGNLWRFSAEAGSNGGGAFILIYLICVFFVGIPVLMSEYLMGRAGQASSAVISVEDLATRSGRSKAWASSAWIGMIASFLIVSFYCVVAAWVMAYIPKFLGGAFDGQTPEQIEGMFGGLVASPKNVLPWFFAFAALTTWLVSRGVNKGIEFASKFLMPVFFVMLICLAIYGVVTGLESGGTQKAVKFLFTPDFSKINGDVAARALGQACFSLGIGSAIMITYGSYLPKDVSIPRSAIIVGSVDTMVALIAGFAIFPIMFTHGLNNAGAGIFFVSLPTALSSIPGGNLIGASFFFLAIFAAVTSSISLLEPIVAWVSEKFNMAKAKAAWVMGSLMTIFGLVSVVNSKFMDFIDVGLTGPIMLPLSALLVVLFTGWRMNQTLISEQMSESDAALGQKLMFMTRWIAVPLVGFFLIYGVYADIIAKYFTQTA